MGRRTISSVARLAAFGVFLAAFAMPGVPAEASKVVEHSVHRDWATRFVDLEEGRVCWVSSSPKNSELSRKNVRRGRVELAVAIRPAKQIASEVTFTAGYPYTQDAAVSLSVSDRSWQMSPRQEYAFPVLANMDEEIVAAFRRGVRAQVKGVSSRGTRSVDTFSLYGFSAALDQARALCKQ